MPSVSWAPRSLMNVRSIRGPNCCEASVSVTIMTEKTTPTTVMSAPASAARICLAASGEPLITQEGRLQLAVEGGVVDAQRERRTAAPRRRSRRPGSATGWCGASRCASPIRRRTAEDPIPIASPSAGRNSCRPGFPAHLRLRVSDRRASASAHDPLADRAEDEHREVDEAADDHDVWRNQTRCGRWPVRTASRNSAFGCSRARRSRTTAWTSNSTVRCSTPTLALSRPGASGAGSPGRGGRGRGEASRPRLGAPGFRCCRG